MGLEFDSEPVPITDWSNLLEELTTNNLSLIDLYVWWNNTVLHCWKESKDIILISGDQKHGKICPPKDSKQFLGSILSKFYTKDLSLLHENEEVIQKFICLNESFFIITDKQNLYGWGWNEHGNFGTGDTEDLNELTFIKTNVVDVYANGAYTILKWNPDE